jgi:hypothetical protein
MQTLLRATAARPCYCQLQGLRTPCVNVAGVQRNGLIQVKSFALNSALWCNNDNFPEGEVGPGNRREQKDACILNEPLAPEPYV